MLEIGGKGTEVGVRSCWNRDGEAFLPLGVCVIVLPSDSTEWSPELWGEKSSSLRPVTWVKLLVLEPLARTGWSTLVSWCFLLKIIKLVILGHTRVFEECMHLSHFLGLWSEISLFHKLI